MILRRLTLANYGRFAWLDISFASGLIIIKGPNEAGKSTLRAALMSVLFGDPRSRSQAVSQRKRWGQDSYYHLQLEYECANAVYRLEKDFENRKERLTDLGTGEEVTERGAVNRLVCEAIGIGSDELFLATACVTQDHIARISGKGKEQVSERLQAVVTGGGDGAAANQLIPALRAGAADLLRGLDRPASHPGSIKRAQDTILALETDIRTARTELESLQQAVADAQRISREIVTKSERLESIRSLLRASDKRADLISRRDSEGRAEEALQCEIDAIRDLNYLIDEKAERVGDFGRLSHLDADAPQSLAKLEATIQALETEKAGAGQDLVRWADMGSQFLSRTTALGAVLPALIGIICILEDLPIPGLVALIVSAAILFRRQSTAVVNKERLARRQEAGSRMKQIEEKLGMAKKERDDIVVRSGCPTSDDLAARFVEWSEVRSQLSEMEAELLGRLGGRALGEMEQERRHHSRKRRDAEEELEAEDVRMADLSPLQRRQYDIERSNLERELSDLHMRESACRAVAESLAVDPSRLHRLDEELAVQRVRLRRLQRLSKVYLATAEGIQDAVAEALGQAKDLLEAQVGDYLSTLTCGKYNSVLVDERSLDFHIYSSERKGLVNAAGTDLSRGACDQFYLAARLALLDLISGQSLTPLILDDPFVTFDDDRSMRAMQLCRTMSERRQVILFTCSDRYDQYADCVENVQPVPESRYS